MRPIDADELTTALDGYQHHITLIKKKSGKIEEAISCDFKGMINSTPTIEERKKGKWIIARMNTYKLLHGTTAYEPVYRCSICGKDVIESGYYCWNCGQHLRWEEEDG